MRRQVLRVGPLSPSLVRRAERCERGAIVMPSTIRRHAMFSQIFTLIYFLFVPEHYLGKGPHRCHTAMDRMFTSDWRHLEVVRSVLDGIVDLRLLRLGKRSGIRLCLLIGIDAS